VTITNLDAKGSKRPHVVVIIADDLGWDDVSFHGSTQIPTPNIDNLAYDGIILNNYYVQHICTPSRASLLTGRYPIHTGMQNGVIMAGQPFGVSLKTKLLPNYMKELGYRTHMVGKWHIGYYAKEFTPTYRGFDSYYGYLQGAETYYSHNCSEEGHAGLDLWDGEDLVWTEDGHYSTELFTEKVENVINKHDPTEPLFMYVAHQATHSSTGIKKLGIPDMEAAPERYLRKYSHIKNKTRRLFAGMLDALDDSVGNITQALENKGMLENTILVFTTDNGGPANMINGNYACNWPLRGTKYLLWEGGTRGASFIWSPLFKSSGYVSNHLMHLVDFVPTLLHGAGYDMTTLPKDLDGVDYWDTLSSGKPGKYDVRGELVMNINPKDGTSAIRVGDLKLIQGHSGWGGNSGWYPPPGVTETPSFMESISFRKEYTIGGPVFKFEQDTSMELDSINRQQLNYKNAFESSTTYKVLRNMGRTPVEPHPVIVDCGPKPANASTNCNLKKEKCLYNITSDPCEYNNLAPSRPDLVQMMMERWTFHNSTMVPTLNKPLDPASLPERNGGAWIPWKTIETTEYIGAER